MRVVGVATVAAVVWGFLATCVLVLHNEPAATVRHALTTAQGLTDLVFIAALVSLQIGVPTGLAGGALALVVVSKEHGQRRFASWIGRGAVWGSCLGATASVLVFALPSLSSDTFPLLLLSMAVIGSIVGGLVGATVGLYCGFAVRQRVPKGKATAAEQPDAADERRA